MEALPKLSPAQALLLRTATRRADGRVIPPETLRGSRYWPRCCSVAGSSLPTTAT